MNATAPDTSWRRLRRLLDEPDGGRAASMLDALARETGFADEATHLRLLWVSRALDARHAVSARQFREVLALLPAAGVEAARRAWGAGDEAERVFFEAVCSAARATREIELWCELSEAGAIRDVIAEISAPGDDVALLEEARARLCLFGPSAVGFALAVADELIPEPSDALRLHALWVSARAAAIRAAARPSDESAASRAVFHTRQILKMLMELNPSIISPAAAQTALLHSFQSIALLLHTEIIPSRTLHALLVVSTEFYLHHLFGARTAPLEIDLRDARSVEEDVLAGIQAHLADGTGILYLIGIRDRLIALLVARSSTRGLALTAPKQGPLKFDLSPLFEGERLEHLSLVRAGWAHALPAGLASVGSASQALIVHERGAGQALTRRRRSVRPLREGRVALWSPTPSTKDVVPAWTQEAELRFLSDHFHHALGWPLSVARGADATQDALERIAPDADLLHLCGLGTRGPRGEPIIVVPDGAGITADVISGLKLARRPLVFLNACDSGATCSIGGRWLDLVSALLDAGAETVLASRVRALSEYAPFFAQAFYRALMFSSAGEAFQRASSALHELRDRLPRPEGWAAPDLESQLTYELHGSSSWAIDRADVILRRSRENYERWLTTLRGGCSR